eukprot:TRINITY_DN20189_c0_g1_i1.p1 TRINITY_DN20189_c0_g1~~TRINITY_DN20189_c0_g1_i1.p1  ORF type:complete len:655 (+),score=158.23 TRINITY_DN20189_c0_g1_i1:95-2059(+)
MPRWSKTNGAAAQPVADENEAPSRDEVFPQKATHGYPSKRISSGTWQPSAGRNAEDLLLDARAAGDRNPADDQSVAGAPSSRPKQTPQLRNLAGSLSGAGGASDWKPTLGRVWRPAAGPVDSHCVEQHTSSMGSPAAVETTVVRRDTSENVPPDSTKRVKAKPKVRPKVKQDAAAQDADKEEETPKTSPPTAAAAAGAGKPHPVARPKKLDAADSQGGRTGNRALSRIEARPEDASQGSARAPEQVAAPRERANAKAKQTRPRSKSARRTAAGEAATEQQETARDASSVSFEPTAKGKKEAHAASASPQAMAPAKESQTTTAEAACPAAATGSKPRKGKGRGKPAKHPEAGGKTCTDHATPSKLADEVPVHAEPVCKETESLPAQADANAASKPLQVSSALRAPPAEANASAAEEARPSALAAENGAGPAVGKPAQVSDRIRALAGGAEVRILASSRNNCDDAEGKPTTPRDNALPEKSSADDCEEDGFWEVMDSEPEQEEKAPTEATQAKAEPTDADEETEQYMAVCHTCFATHTSVVDFVGLGLEFYCSLVGARCEDDAQASSSRPADAAGPSKEDKSAPLTAEERQRVFHQFAGGWQNKDSRKEVQRGAKDLKAELDSAKMSKIRYRDNQIATHKGEKVLVQKLYPSQLDK